METVLGRGNRSKKNSPAILIEAWYHALPHTQGKIENIFMKKNYLYVKVSSPFLRHDLYTQKNKTKLKLKEAIESLGGDSNGIDEIFFI